MAGFIRYQGSETDDHRKKYKKILTPRLARLPGEALVVQIKTRLGEAIVYKKKIHFFCDFINVSVPYPDKVADMVFKTMFINPEMFFWSLEN